MATPVSRRRPVPSDGTARRVILRQARYEDTCWACGSRIEKGSVISWSPSAGPRHKVCP